MAVNVLILPDILADIMLVRNKHTHARVHQVHVYDRQTQRIF